MLSGRTAEALAITERAHEYGADLGVVLVDLLDLLHTLTRLKLVPTLRQSGELPEAERVRGGAIADRVDMATLGRAWQMLLKGIGEVEAAPDRRAAGEDEPGASLPRGGVADAGRTGTAARGSPQAEAEVVAVARAWLRAGREQHRLQRLRRRAPLLQLRSRAQSVRPAPKTCARSLQSWPNGASRACTHTCNTRYISCVLRRR